jgi:putative protease
VAEETRPGEYFPIEENERGTYIFNSRDLCMIGHLPELAGAGVDSLKIEGRMKTALYVASITRAYRRAIDDYLESDEKYKAGMDWYMREIRKCTYRDFTTGFYFGRPDTLSMVYTDNTYASDAVFLGIIEDAQPAGMGTRGFAAPAGMDTQGFAAPSDRNPQAGERRLVTFRQKNKFAVGDVIEIMRPDGTDLQARVLGMWNEEGEPVPDAPHPGELIRMELDAPAEAGNIMRTWKQA